MLAPISLITLFSLLLFPFFFLLLSTIGIFFAPYREREGERERTKAARILPAYRIILPDLSLLFLFYLYITNPNISLLSRLQTHIRPVKKNNITAKVFSTCSVPVCCLLDVNQLKASIFTPKLSNNLRMCCFLLNIRLNISIILIEQETEKQINKKKLIFLYTISHIKIVQGHARSLDM